MVPDLYEWRAPIVIPHSRPFIGTDEAEAVDAVVRSGMLLGGGRVPTFCRALSELTGLRGATLFSSGRMAIRAALEALRLPPQSEIVVQTYVCDAVVWAIRQNGLNPVFCDVGDGWTATGETVAAVWTPRCAAIVLAPPFGLYSPVQEFRQFAAPIIHDLCQASPFAIQQLADADCGDTIALSFHPTKYVCAAGGGALISKKDEPLAQSIASMWADASPIGEVGAAMGQVQLSRAHLFRHRRAEIASDYLAAAGTRADRLHASFDAHHGDLLRLPLQSMRLRHDEVIAHFAAGGVTARRGVDQLAHRSVGQPDRHFPNAIARFEQTFSLPFYPALSERDQETIADLLVRLR